MDFFKNLHLGGHKSDPKEKIEVRYVAVAFTSLKSVLRIPKLLCQPHHVGIVTFKIFIRSILK